MTPLADRLLDALPQTQCTRCGFADCAGYAQAIAAGEAGIDRCPPGGAEGVRRLAARTGQAIVPLDPSYGAEAPRTLAVIDEAWCIGCTRCLDACPTDAIVGIHKRMHTVIAPHCTGCELCLPACPVDCIERVEATPGHSGWNAWSEEQADAARTRYAARQARLAAKARPAASAQPTAAASDDGARKRSVVEAALARARAAAQRKA